jgi:hypothetical protein
MRNDAQDRAARLAELERDNAALRCEVARLSDRKAALQADFRAKHPSAHSRRAVTVAVQESLGVSERRACKALASPARHSGTKRRASDLHEDSNAKGAA